MSSEESSKEEEDRQEPEAPVEAEATPLDAEESRVAEMAKKVGVATSAGFKKARPVVVSGAKKGGHLAAVGGRKGCPPGRGGRRQGQGPGDGFLAEGHGGRWTTERRGRRQIAAKRRGGP